MSHDIQFTPSSGPLGSGGDLWSGTTTAETRSGGGGFKKIHRLLRGRYWLAGILAAVCATMGGVAGYMSQQPAYRSDGIIEIRPTLPSVQDLDRIMPMYTAYIQSQAALVQDQRVIMEAMGSDDWKGTGRGMSPEAIAGFINNLDVEYIKNSQLIRVSFLDTDPTVAPTAVRAVISAYRRLFVDVNSRDTTSKLQYLQSVRDTLASQLKAKKEQILAIGEPYGTVDLEILHNAKMQGLVQLEGQLAQAKFAMAATKAALGSEKKQAGDMMQSVSLKATQIAERDKTMALLMDQRDQQQALVNRLLQTYGENHPQLIRARHELDFIDRQIEHRVQMLEMQPMANQISPDGSSTIMVSAETADQLAARVNYLSQLYEKERTSTAEIGRARVRIQGLQNDIDSLKEQVNQTSRAIDNLTVEQVLSPQLQVLSYGSNPVSPAVDRRKVFGVLGTLGGGILPVAVLLLIGLMDKRYRYSDDTGSEITLLGILPNLPDQLSDPEQARMAAHCVHQIRTMLQINSTEDQRVFAITSASPEDGKTSLTLALGLSFAASGSRTLLIDCDLVGGGLSSRLNIHASEGVLEAIAARSLTAFVKPTGIADMSILPVGNIHANHPSGLSPAMLRRLVEEAKREYDTVLVDTGPILGSIEASLVTSAADAVILTVARGQYRPLVEKSLAHLSGIGAKMAGVVFNRAQTKDFNRSISRLSLQPGEVSENGNGHEDAAPHALGPVARAVAGSVGKKGGRRT